MKYGLEAIFSLSFVPPGLKPIPLFREMPLGRPCPLPLFFLSSFIQFHFQEGQGLRNGWLREETMSFCPGPSSVPCCSPLGSSSSTQVSLCPWRPSSLMLEARVRGAVLGAKYQRSAYQRALLTSSFKFSTAGSVSNVHSSSN